MNELIIANKHIPLTKSGFLINITDWTEEVAEALAKQENIELTKDHWAIIKLSRDFYQQHEFIPPLRVFIKHIKTELGPHLGNSITLHKLFTNGPMKQTCRIAGLPKPKHCM